MYLTMANCRGAEGRGGKSAPLTFMCDEAILLEPLPFGRDEADDGPYDRQVLESRGYRVDRNNVRINRAGNIFVSVTRYASP